MKSRLLKKTRKRFEILHLPQGFTSGGDRYDFNLFKLVDSTNNYIENYAQFRFNEAKGIQFCPADQIFNTEHECINYLKSLIIIRLRREGHLGAKDRKIKASIKKIWHI